MLMVFRGLKRESDGVEDCEGPGIWMTLSYVAFTESESTIDSKEVGRESNAMDSISVEFDTRLLRESRQMDVYCKRPMQCPVIPTKWVEVKGMLEANQL